MWHNIKSNYNRKYTRKLKRCGNNDLIRHKIKYVNIKQENKLRQMCCKLMKLIKIQKCKWIMQYRIKMKSNKYWHYIRYFC